MGVKHQVNEAFFDTWPDEMAYVLGYMFADGNIIHYSSTRAKYIRFYSTDRDRIELIQHLMGASHRIIVEERKCPRKTIYRIQIGSHRLFSALMRLKVTPRKSLTCELPSIPKKYLAPFVLGYFDGDGCAFVERSRNGKPKRLLSIFTSGSKCFLEDLHERLAANYGILGRGLYKHGSSVRTYQLRYSTRDSIRLFILLYETKNLRRLALLRKYAIFIKYFEEKGITVLDLPVILTKKGPVAK